MTSDQSRATFLGVVPLHPRFISILVLALLIWLLPVWCDFPYVTTACVADTERIEIKVSLGARTPK
jgi:hypothetical protein